MKIALVHPHGGMGDLILTYPVITTFRDAYPNAELIFITSKGMEEVVQVNPLVSEVVSLGPGFLPAFKLSQDLKARKIEIACALWTTSRVAWMLKLASIPIRVGQGDRFFSSFLFTHQVQVRSTQGDVDSHWVECLLDYPRVLGFNGTKKEIRILLSPASLERAHGLLKQIRVLPRSYVVIHCGKGENLLQRGWPADKFALLADRLLEKGFEVIFTGREAEVPLIREIEKKMKGKAHSLAGETNFLTLAALLKLADLLICPDSGPMHLAAAVGTPVVALFLMKKDYPKRWSPCGPHEVIRPTSFPCQDSCTKENCSNFKCYQAMLVPEILEAAFRLINTSSKVSP